MKAPEKIVKDSEMVTVFHNTNFGDRTPRFMLADGVNKVAQGYATGYTVECILLELELTKRSKGRKLILTDKGIKYLQSVGQIKYT